MAPTPLPLPSFEDRPHWDGLRRHEFLIQECADCGALRHPPKPMCQACQSTKERWRKASGRGVVYSYTILHQASHPAWKEKIPYNVVVVALEEGVRVIGNMIDCPNEQIRIGMPVQVAFEDVAEDVTLPRFTPQTQAGRTAAS